jgi:hypothetical protein
VAKGSPACHRTATICLPLHKSLFQYQVEHIVCLQLVAQQLCCRRAIARIVPTSRSRNSHYPRHAPSATYPPPAPSLFLPDPMSRLPSAPAISTLAKKQMPVSVCRKSLLSTSPMVNMLPTPTRFHSRRCRPSLHFTNSCRLCPHHLPLRHLARLGLPKPNHIATEHKNEPTFQGLSRETPPGQ